MCVCVCVCVCVRVYVCVCMCTASGRLSYDVARVTSFIGGTHKLLDVTLPNYLVGDFDLRNIDRSFPCTLGLYPENIFASFVIENGLTLLLNEYMRETAILDLVFTDCNDSVEDVMVCEPFSTSDHFMIWFHLMLPGRLNPAHVIEPEAQFNNARADWVAVNLTLSIVNDRVSIETV